MEELALPLLLPLSSDCFSLALSHSLSLWTKSIRHPQIMSSRKDDQDTHAWAGLHDSQCYLHMPVCVYICLLKSSTAVFAQRLWIKMILILKNMEEGIMFTTVHVCGNWVLSPSDGGMFWISKTIPKWHRSVKEDRKKVRFSVHARWLCVGAELPYVL